MPGRRSVRLLVLLALVCAAAALAGTHRGSGATGVRTGAAVDPQVAMGGHLFVQFACSACHGLQGRGGMSPYVPALTKVGKALTVAQLGSIIKHGLGESANPKQPYMPVWGAVISKTQVSNLVAYIRAGLPAVADAQPVSVPEGQGAAVAGAALYVRYGCVNCHGPKGRGGVPNPQSPDKTIPALGADFF